MHRARRLSAARRGVKRWLLAATCLLGCDSAAPATAFRGAAECGNGRVEDGEACDLGFANRPDGPCRTCALPRCGDGIVDEGEACDEGDEPTGRCTAACTEVWPRQWTRTIDRTRYDEPVVAIAPLHGGDFVHVGAGADDAAGRASVEVTRRTAEADVVWRAIGEAPVGLTVRDAAMAEDGTVHVIADSADHVAADETGVVWVGAVSPDGDVQSSMPIVGQPLADCEVRGEAIVAAPSSSEGVAVAWLGAVVCGTRGVWPLQDDGTLGSAVLSGRPPTHGLAVSAGGLFVGTGSRDEPGGIAYVGWDGALGWEEPALVGRGEVVGLDWDGARLLVVATEVTGGEELPALARPTQVRLSALSGTGQTQWSTVTSSGNPREAAALAVVGDEIVVIGSERLPAAVCSDNLCPTQPWIGTFDAQTGESRRSWRPDDVALGAGTAVAVDDDAVWVGGGTHRVFARPEGWLVRMSRAGAP